MKFNITFQLLRPGQLLPLSYQYELSSWIYQRIGDANQDFANFLHEEGYVAGKKRFKFFSFSRLGVPRFEIQGDRMKILCSEVSFVISFLVPQAAQELILGIFKEEQFQLGDYVSRVDLRVKSIDVLPQATFSHEPQKFRTSSPLMLSRAGLMKNGKLGHQYLSPRDQGYEELFIRNLKEKHQSALKHGLAESIEGDAKCSFRLLNNRAKSQLIRIKANKEAETKVRAYLFDFELKAPPELIRTGFLAGFGGENALGFGAVSMIGGNRKKNN
ncbi:MAG: CRISPR-associated endoribonuclease Cas6 [Bacteroidota bacterium]